MTTLREPVRTTKRRGRVTLGQGAALERLWPLYGLDPDGPLTPAAVFGRSAPLVLDIGPGNGEATVELAAAEPERDVLACELHLPGQGSLLLRAHAAGLSNVRVLGVDVREVLADLLGPGSLDVVRVFFPDPWPKTKHVRRRLLDDDFAALVADRLRPGGLLHVATDWAPYAAQVRRVIVACPGLAPASAPPRPRTQFERKGLAAGRPAHDLAARAVRPPG